MMKKCLLSLFLLLLIIPSYGQSTNDSRLKLLFVGDIMGHGPQIKSAYDATTKTYNYNPVFKYVSPVISKADLAVGNLEVTLPGEPPYKGYPMFRSPDELATALRMAGFDMLVTSNNHSNDGGIKGINHTIDVLKNLGFYQTGTFKNLGEKEVYYPLMVYKDGFRIAFLNYTYGTNGLPTRTPTIVNLIDEDKIKADLDFAKKLKPDYTIVVVHWGDEYQLKENAGQRKLAANILKWGGDMVIGAHPHVVQPIKKETVTLSDGSTKEGLVAYSLGNFISNQQKTNTDGGIMLEVELIKNGTTQTTVSGAYNYIPVWRYHNRKNQKNKYGTYHAVPIAAFEEDKENLLKLSANEQVKMAAYAKKVRQHLNSYGATERKVTLEELGLAGNIDQSYIDHGKENQKIFGTQNVARGYAPVPVRQFQRDTVPTSAVPGRPSKSVPGRKKNSRTVSREPTTTTTTTTPSPTTTTRPVSPPPVVTPGSPFVKAKSLPAFSPSQQQPEPPTSSTQGLVKQKYYRIQFQTTQNMYDPATLPFEGVEIEQTPEGLFRYYAGSTPTLKEAQQALTVVRNAGFKDAFVATYEKLVPMNKKPLADPIESKPSYKGVAKGITTYKVQVQSTRNFYGAIQTDLPFDDVEIQEFEGWYRYYVGEATTLEEAKALLVKIREKGFPQAFLVTFKGGERVKN